LPKRKKKTFIKHRMMTEMRKTTNENTKVQQ